MFNYYMNIIIKPKNELDLPQIANCIQNAFKIHNKIIFIFDLTETNVFNIHSLMRILPLLKKFERDIELKLQKSYIIVKQNWKKRLLLLFFSYYKPKKPVEFYDELPQNHGLSSNVLL